MSHIDSLIQAATQQYREGKLQLAANTCQAILQQEARHAEAWHLLALVMWDTGQLAPALEGAIKAAEFAPQRTEFALTVVSLLMVMQRYFDAEQMARAILKSDPNNAEATRQLALAISQIGRHADAHPVLEQAVALFPDSSELWSHFGNSCRQLGFTVSAIDAYRRLATMNPADTKSLMALGELLLEVGQAEEAVQHFSNAINVTPGDAAPYLGACVACQKIGRFDLAVSTAKHVLKKDAANPRAWYLLCQLVRDGYYELEADEVPKLLAFEKNASLNGEAFRQTRFALACYFEAQGDLERAQRYYLAANSARLRELRIKGTTRLVDQQSEYVSSIINVFSAELLDWARQAGVGTEAARPVFLVSLPDVGNDPLAKVVTKATGLAWSGRRPDADYLAWRGAAVGQRSQLVAEEAFPYWVNGRDAEYLTGLANLYQNRTQQMVGEGNAALDSLTHGAAYVGLLALMFPQAKFIHLRRDAREVSWARWQANEASDEAAAFSSSLMSLATEAREHERLLEHWQTVLGDAIYEVDAIDFTADPENSLRELLTFLGVEWSESASAAAAEWLEPASGKSWTAFASMLEDFLAALEPELAEAAV